MLRPTQRVRQSPSLPLNLQNGGVQTPSHSTSSPQRANHPAPSSRIPRSRCSAPDLKFLTEPQNLSQTTPDRVPVKLSCPDNKATQSKLPFRVNTVEDWDSLRV